MTRLPWILLVLLLGGLSLFAVTQADWGDFERGPVGRERGLWDLAGSGTPAHFARTDQPLQLHLLAALAGDDSPDVVDARRLLRGIFVPLLALFVWLLLRRRVGPWAALAGAAAAGISGPVLLLAGSLEAGAPATVLLLAALVLLDRSLDTASLAAAGGLAGVAAWFVPELGWSILVLLVAFLLARPPRREALVLAATFLVLAVGTGRLLGHHAWLPAPSGVEIYQGHRTGHRGGDPIRGDRDAGRWWTGSEYRAHASREAGRALDDDRVSRYWVGQAAAEALRAPHRELLRTGVKTLGALQSSPLPRGVSAAYLSEEARGPGVRIGLWAGRILLAVGAAGLWLARRRLGAPLAAGLLGGVLAAWWTTLSGDARGVTVCLLAVGFGLWIDALRRRPLAAVGFGVLGLGLLGLLPLVGAVPGLARGPLDDFHLGVLFQAEGRGTAAIRQYDRALRIDETLPYPRMALADLLAEDQVLDEATREYERVREAYPDMVRPPERLSLLYQQQERWPEMIVVNQALVTLDPTSPEFHNNLGTAFLGAGFFQRAEAEFKEALRLNPRYEVARKNLEGMESVGFAAGEDATRTLSPQTVLLLLRERRYEEARVSLDSLFARQGDDPQLWFLEASLLMETGHADSAVTLLESLRDTLANPYLEHNLATGYVRTGRYLDALTVWADLARANPSNQVFQQSLARIQRDLRDGATRAVAAGDREAAVIIWEHLAQAVPERPDYADSLAAVRALGN